MKKSFSFKLIIFILLFFITHLTIAAVNCNIRPLESGTDYSGCNLSGIIVESNTNLSGINFTNANLTNAILMGVNLSNAKFNNAILESTVVSNSNLTGADLNYANLHNAQFQNIIGINSLNFFDTVNVQGIDLSDNIINNMYLLQPYGASKDYTDAKFEHTVFFEVNLGGANLTNASFLGATLASLNLGSSILIGANFNFAQIAYTHTDDTSNFTDADVRGAQFNYTMIMAGVTGFELDDSHLFKNLVTDNTTEFFYTILPTGEICSILSKGSCLQ